MSTLPEESTVCSKMSLLSQKHAVPTGYEGRAGMAAVIVRQDAAFDGPKLFEHVLGDLPVYARPLFIRLQVMIHVSLVRGGTEQDQGGPLCLCKVELEARAK